MNVEQCSKETVYLQYTVLSGNYIYWAMFELPDSTILPQNNEEKILLFTINEKILECEEEKLFFDLHHVCVLHRYDSKYVW